MNAILGLLQKLNPTLGKNVLFKVLEYAVLLIALYGLYADATGNLSNAKANRDEQMKGYAVQVGVNHTEVYILKHQVEDLEAANEKLEIRIHRLEERIIRGH